MKQISLGITMICVQMLPKPRPTRIQSVWTEHLNTSPKYKSSLTTSCEWKYGYEYLKLIFCNDSDWRTETEKTNCDQSCLKSSLLENIQRSAVWKKGKSTKLFSMTNIRNTKTFTETLSPPSTSSESWMWWCHSSSGTARGRRWDVSTSCVPVEFCMRANAMSGSSVLVF